MKVFNGGSAWMEAQKALVDEWMANARAWPSALRVAEQAQRVRKGATPSEVVYEEEHFMSLHTRATINHKTPLLFVFALVNRPYILDILPTRASWPTLSRPASTPT